MRVTASVESADDIVVDFPVDPSVWCEVPPDSGSIGGNARIVLRHVSGMRLRGKVAADGTSSYELPGGTLEKALRELPASSARMRICVTA